MKLLEGNRLKSATFYGTLYRVRYKRTGAKEIVGAITGVTKFTMAITGFSRDQQKQQLFDRQSSSDLRKKEKQSFLGAVAGCRLQAIKVIIL